MGLRKFKLPDDAQIIMDVIPPAFQYPDHPEWSIDPSDEEDIVEMMKSVKTIWPILRGIGLVWKPAQDLFLGYVWEEDGQPVGICNALRQGGSQQWVIGNVAVLPEYRRRGIARKLVQACVDLAIERGAQQIILDVIDGNLPAYELYKSMGFNHFSGRLIYEHTAEVAELPTTPFPPTYTTRKATFKDWRLRYELAQRITPAHVQEFEPVTEDKYSIPPVIRAVQPIIMRLMRIQTGRVLVNDAEGTVVAFANYQVHKNGKGNQSIGIALDKNHAVLSQALLEQFLKDVRQLAPTSKIELNIPDWQYCEEELDPRLVGFHQTIIYHRLGMQI